MKFKLNKVNKYKGFVKAKELVKDTILEIKNDKFLLGVISIPLALGIMATGALISIPLSNEIDNITNSFNNTSNLYYLSGEMECDVDKLKLFLFDSEYKDTYNELEEKYNNMTNLEKRKLVLNIFCNIIDKSDEFTIEEKNILKEKEGKFLLRYGNNYEFKNIFGMTNRLNHIMVLREQFLNKEDETDNHYTNGTYNFDSNTIKIDVNANENTIGHEVEHAISINRDNGIFPSFILEAIDSSTDLYYYNDYSYCKTMRLQVLFLSEIIGRDNLMKCYLNNDIKLLNKLIGEHSKDLLDIFNKELKAYKESEIDDDLISDAANLLKKIYEEKYKTSIKDNEKIYIIYKSLLDGIKITTNETMFYNDNFTYEKSKKILFRGINSLRTHNIKIEYTLNNKNELIKRNLKLPDDIYTIASYKLDYLFTPDIYKKIIKSDNPSNTLREYLESIGIKNTDFWVYNILNKNNSIAVSIDFKDLYNKEFFYSDLKIIYKDKYNYLKDRDELYKISNNIGIVFNNEDHEAGDILNVDVLNILLSKAFNYDFKDLSDKELLSKYYELFNNELENNISEINLMKIYLLFGKDNYNSISSNGSIYNSLKEYFSLITKDSYQINQAIFYILNDKEKFPLKNDVIIDIMCDRVYNSSNIVIDYCDFNELLSYDGYYFELTNHIKEKYNVLIDLDRYSGLYWKKKDYSDDNYSIMGFDRRYATKNVILPNIDINYVFTNDNYYIDSSGEEVVGFIKPSKINYIDDDFIQYIFDDIGFYDIIHITGNDRGLTMEELGIGSKSSIKR